MIKRCIKRKKILCPPVENCSFCKLAFDNSFGKILIVISGKIRNYCCFTVEFCSFCSLLLSTPYSPYNKLNFHNMILIRVPAKLHHWEVLSVATNSLSVSMNLFVRTSLILLSARTDNVETA